MYSGKWLSLILIRNIQYLFYCLDGRRQDIINNNNLILVPDDV